ncbi:MAG: hypothetical protein LBM75_09800 [Myxococcales bacterium]|jgi:hypothetical protein|nr:hypothetical protein [Myxococcales bacterium]
MKTTKRTAVLDSSQAQVAHAPESASAMDEGLWSIGLMRVAVEWSDPRAPALAEVVRSVAERMALPPEPFELFVAERLGALTAG